MRSRQCAEKDFHLKFVIISALDQNLWCNWVGQGVLVVLDAGFSSGDCGDEGGIISPFITHEGVVTRAIIGDLI